MNMSDVGYCNSCCCCEDSNDDREPFFDKDKQSYNTTENAITTQPQQSDPNLIQPNEKLHQRIKKLEVENKALKEKHDDKLNKRIKELQSENKTLNEKHSELLVKQGEEIKRLQKLIESKDVTIHDYSKRLSAEMSTKVSADESSIENVAIINRPTNVAEEYLTFCSNGWMDAKDELDTLYPDPDYSNEDKLKLLAHIIQVSDSECKSYAGQNENKIKTLLSEICQPTSEHTTTDQTALFQEESREAKNAIGDYLRNISSKVNLQEIIQQVYKCIDEEISNMGSPQQYFDMWPKFKQTDKCKQYIENITRITWKMALQRPPMHFVHSSTTTLNEECYELFWQSETGPNVCVVEVYPAVYHSKQRMAKGKVFCYKKDTQ